MQQYQYIKGADLEYQIRTKNELMAVSFDDPQKQQIFEALIERFVNGKKGFKLFAKSSVRDLEQRYGKEKLLSVLQELNSFNLLPNELYPYLQAEGQQAVAGELDATPYLLPQVSLAIFSAEPALSILKAKAKALQFKNIQIHPLDREYTDKQLEKLLSEVDFFIADAFSWSPKQFQLINKKALALNKPWLYLEGINLNKIKIGPIFHGHETGCYNCLMKRLKSNRQAEMLSYDETYEQYLDEYSLFAKPDQSPYPTALIYDIAASMAMLEIIRFFKYWSVPALWRHYLTLDVNTLQTESHRLLKVPTCEVCKPKLEYNAAPWLESISLSHDQ
jgi:bacteriocin biosynthesis cyclodehydratase domain-containing protein